MYLDWHRIYIDECDMYFGYRLSLFRTFACCDSFTKSVQVILILWYLHFYCAVHTQHVHSALCAMVHSSVHLCHKPVFCWNGSSWFLAQGLPAAYPTVCFKRIRVSPKVHNYTSSQMPNVGDFSAFRMTPWMSHVVSLIQSSQICHTEHSPVFTTRCSWCRLSLTAETCRY